MAGRRGAWVGVVALIAATVVARADAPAGAASDRTWTTGRHTVLAIVVEVGGTASPRTLGQMEDTFAEMAAMVAGTSDGQLEMVPTVVGPLAVASCDVGPQSGRVALEAAVTPPLAGAGVVVDAFDHVVYMLAGCSGINGEAMGEQPGDRVWAHAHVAPSTLTHELGHNLDADHANAWECDQGTIDDPSCTSVEYGDTRDPMGLFDETANFSGPTQWRLGWLVDGRMAKARTGRYTLESLDRPSGLQVLTVPRQDGSTLFLEYRAFQGFETLDALPAEFRRPGVGIRLVGVPRPEQPGFPRASQLQLGGPSGAHELEAGDSWSTPGGDVAVSVVSTTAQHAVVDVVVREAAYVPVNPDRLLDTRSGVGAPAGRLAPDGVTAVDVTGRGTSQLPDDARAVVLNVTSTDAAAPGFVTVWPCGQPRPVASNLNVVPGRDLPNAVLTKVGDGGTVCLSSQGPVHLVADLAGYYPASSTIVPISPVRLLDTRAPITEVLRTWGLPGGSSTGGIVAGGRTVVLDVSRQGTSPVPRAIGAVALNVTAVGPAAPGYLTAWPCNQPRPESSNLNMRPGQAVPNLVVSQVDPDGEVCLYVQTTTHLVVDATGFFALGSPYQPVNPDRVLDTRSGVGAPAAKVAPGATLVLDVTGRGTSQLPATAGAVVLNVTATEADAPGYVTVWPCGEPRPLASSLNVVPGIDVANAVVAKVGSSGTVCLTSLHAVHLIADIDGYEPAA